MDTAHFWVAVKLDVPTNPKLLIGAVQNKQNGKYAPHTSPLAPLGGYPLFPLGEEAGALGPLGSDGNTQGTLSPLSELVSSQGDMLIARWRHYQMSIFFYKLEPQVRTLSSLTTFETLCTKMSKSNHLLSEMYKLVHSCQNISTPTLSKSGGEN